MPFSFAVVCEAPSDKEIACVLADRVLCERVGWISEEVLDEYRKWRGLSEGDSFLAWKDIPKLSKQANIRIRGHYEGKPGEPDARVAHRALTLLRRRQGDLHGVLLIRDDDRDRDRRRGMEQARTAVGLRVPVVIGLSHLKRECWVLAGFEPADEDETRRLEELRQELGFDPRTHAHELTAKHDHDKRSAKRVLGLLTGDNPERECACWLQGSLHLLEVRGEETGLADYLREIRTRLVPLFTA